MTQVMIRLIVSVNLRWCALFVAHQVFLKPQHRQLLAHFERSQLLCTKVKKGDVKRKRR